MIDVLTYEIVSLNTVSILKLNLEDTLYFCHQEALITAKADALRWQSLYEEVRLCSGQLRENQHLSNEQLQQLHSQVEVRIVCDRTVVCSEVSMSMVAKNMLYVSCAAVQSQRGRAEGGGGVIKTREKGATKQHLSAGRGQPAVNRGDPAP